MKKRHIFFYAILQFFSRIHTAEIHCETWIKFKRLLDEIEMCELKIQKKNQEIEDLTSRINANHSCILPCFKKGNPNRNDETTLWSCQYSRSLMIMELIRLKDEKTKWQNSIFVIFDIWE